jgi:hypothetical protein
MTYTPETQVGKDPAEDLFEETPKSCWYELTMYRDSATVKGQDFDLTLSEFLALKNHLATIRGLAVPRSENNGAPGVESSEEQRAIALIAALVSKDELARISHK